MLQYKEKIENEYENIKLFSFMQYQIQSVCSVITDFSSLCVDIYII